MTSFRTWCGAVAGAVLFVLNASAVAQDWPTRSMLVVSAVTAGNAGDIIARIVLEQVSKQIGQSFVIENRPGAGGTIGSASVAKADPDGYTILLLSSSQGSYLVLHKTLPYHPLRDFAPVVLFGVQPSVLVAAPSKGWTSVGDLIAAAKARPGALILPPPASAPLRTGRPSACGSRPASTCSTFRSAARSKRSPR